MVYTKMLHTPFQIIIEEHLFWYFIILLDWRAYIVHIYGTSIYGTPTYLLRGLVIRTLLFYTEGRILIAVTRIIHQIIYMLHLLYYYARNLESFNQFPSGDIHVSFKGSDPILFLGEGTGLRSPSERSITVSRLGNLIDDVPKKWFIHQRNENDESTD